MNKFLSVLFAFLSFAVYSQNIHENCGCDFCAKSRKMHYNQLNANKNQKAAGAEIDAPRPRMTQMSGCRKNQKKFPGNNRGKSDDDG